MHQISFDLLFFVFVFSFFFFSYAPSVDYIITINSLRLIFCIELQKPFLGPLGNVFHSPLHDLPTLKDHYRDHLDRFLENKLHLWTDDDDYCISSLLDLPLESITQCLMMGLSISSLALYWERISVLFSVPSWPQKPTDDNADDDDCWRRRRWWWWWSNICHGHDCRYVLLVATGLAERARDERE